MLQMTALLISLLTWNDLEFDSRYLLTEKLPLSSSITLKVGTKLKHLDQIPLDEIRVQIFQFQVENCSAALLIANTEIEIYKDTYGLKLNPGCLLEVFVENKDLPLTTFLNPLE